MKLWNKLRSKQQQYARWVIKMLNKYPWSTVFALFAPFPISVGILVITGNPILLMIVLAHLAVIITY